MNNDGDGHRAGAGTGVEASKRTQDGNEDGAGTGQRTGVGTGGRTQYRNEDGNGDGSERSSGDGNGNGGWNGDRDRDGDGRRIMCRTKAQGRQVRDSIWEGGGEAYTRKKSHKSCRRDVGNGRDLGGNRRNVDKKVLFQ